MSAPSLGSARRPWWLLAPTLLVLGVLLLWPIVRVVVLSLQDFGLRELVRGGAEFIALDNYVAVLTNERLWRIALPNTVVFAAACVVLTVVVGTLIALVLHQLSGVWRTLVTMAIMAAWAVPAVTGTYVWVYLFDAREGFLTGLLAQAGLIDLATQNLFSDRGWFYAIATLNVVHHGFPFVAVTVLAGLTTIPQELHEAAMIDGATAWQRFRQITLPLLKPVFAIVTILSTIWDFKVFTQIYLMPGGDGANRSVLNLGTWSYVTAMSQNNYGMGAAIAVLLTLLLLAVTVIYLRTLFREEEL
ncbi:carbohydrate ABC transporter permease [Ornithinimicrobium pekingense]|uniref:Sugar ABC transporter permease n=1 Tax=Ornithinimicrobium pekingense TaxID=384677 RepID=A0ABQ2F506_9MICO|nr:sugar ABC transporter permease [Ornithinimicrobium pekingense]GGK60473.1 sugar ABC transporter permease [Ornithinimicrobium pekingense]